MTLQKTILLGTVCILLLAWRATATVYYVNVSNTMPASPYTSWATAATSIQEAINVSSAGDEVLVTNGIYQTGAVNNGGQSNRVYVSKAILVHSVNGPLVTVIKGHQVPVVTNDVSSIRCVYLTQGILSGFTLAGGSTLGAGGGISCFFNVVVSNCVITGNSSSGFGGGGYQGKYQNCIFSGNTSGTYGGGAYQAMLQGCQVIGNVAGNSGGGVCSPNGLTNCVIFGNSAIYGGGVYCQSPLAAVISGCSIVGNFASSYCGGIWGGSLTNCIVYYNTVGSFSSYGTNIANTTLVSSCCTTPTNGFGPNNITSAPGFVNVDGGDLHLAPWSPCIDVGNSAATNSFMDLDGNPRIVNGVVDMGAYEFLSQPSSTVHFVSLSNTVPVAPFTNWATAATNIQDAIDAAAPGDLVLVSNGIYRVGARIVYGLQTNRVVVDKAITVQALAGAKYTLISGGGFTGPRCVYLTNGATLLGFTLTNGWAQFSGESLSNKNGGGAWCESSAAMLSNCIFVANGAGNYGGGAYSGTLVNCIIRANSASYGGGTFNSTLIGCSVSNNVASSRGGGSLGGYLTNCFLMLNNSPFGGGTCSNTLYGCILQTNWASKTGGGAYSCTLTNCILYGNYATNGGGAVYGSLDGCVLTNNWAGNGGGSCSNTLVNCVIMGNVAATNGGGVMFGDLNNCTLAGNTANGYGYGGGSYYSNLTNCIVVANLAATGSGMAGGTGSGCFVSNNIAYLSGAVVSNILIRCMLYNNTNRGSAFSTLYYCSIIDTWGDGSYRDSLNNCLVLFSFNGNGANSSVLNNCTVISNGFGGFPGQYYYGVRDCNVTNSIVYFNSARGNYFTTLPGPSLDHCCTFPLPPGSGNFTNAPLFLDAALHLASNSACIDTGNNAFVVGNTDLDGRPRLVNGTVDVGAMEFQGVDTEPFVSWLYKYGLPNDGSVDYADLDGDGMDNWGEWIAGVNPTNTLSALTMSAITTNSSPGTSVTWQSVTNVTYFVQRSSDLLVFTSIQNSIAGLAGSTSYTDTTATNDGPYYYRVGVQQ